MKKYQDNDAVELIKDLKYHLKRHTEKFYNQTPMSLANLDTHLKDVVIETLNITSIEFGNFGLEIWRPCMSEVQSYRLLNLIRQALFLGKFCIFLLFGNFHFFRALTNATQHRTINISCSLRSSVLVSFVPFILFGGRGKTLLTNDF